MNIFKKVLVVSSISILLSSNILPCLANTRKKNDLKGENYYSYNEEFDSQNITEFGDIASIENEENNSNYTKEFKEYLNLSDEEKEKVEVVPRKYEVSFDDFFNNINGKKNETVSNKEKNDNTKVTKNRNSIIVESSGEGNEVDTNLPELYNLKNEINIKTENQGNYGICWDFASVKSLETYLSLKGYGDFDFSELHVDYLTSNEFGGWRELHDGGNFEVFEEYLAQTNGPVYEEEVPYNASYTMDNYDYLLSIDNKAYVSETVKLPSIYKYIDENNNLVYLKNYNYIPGIYDFSYSQTDIISEEQIEMFRNYVKKHIMENGGLYCTIVSPYYGMNYLNSANNSEYYAGTDDQLGKSKEFHAVTIVGWDDNYSKENFNQNNRPQNDGAYIVLNSWGEEYGNQGYYYVSYDDFYIESQLSGIKNASTVASEDSLIKISVEDQNLYNGLKEELGNFNIVCDDNTFEIGLTELIMKNIISLNLSGRGIHNISGLEKFLYLERLDLSNNEIEDTTVFQSENAFYYLQYLDLNHNKIQNIDLSGLNNLDDINISNNEISNINFITNLEKLRKLRADNNNLEAFPILNSNIQNALVYLSGNKGLDVSTMSIDRISVLDLSNCNLNNEKAMSLPSSSDLKQLSLANNPIDSVDFLSKYDLTNLDISYTGIADLSEISNNEFAENIVGLNASGIENIQGIESLTKIKFLYLDNCNLSDLSKFENLDELLYLSLKENNITSIEYLKDLNLVNLNLDSNPNVDLNTLKDFTSLENISLQNCNISDILDIINNLNLSYIDLSNNNINNINLLTGIDNRAIHLILNNNKIDSFPSVAAGIDFDLKNQNVVENYELQTGKINYIEFPEIINKAYDERYKRQIIFECENCELDLNSRYIKINSVREGTGQAKIKIVGGSFDESYYTINYEMIDNIAKVGIETEYSGRVLYVEGEDFDVENLKVFVLFDNGLMEEITDYEIENNLNLQPEQESVKIKYEDFESNIGIAVYREDDVKNIKFNDQGIFNSFILTNYDYESGLIFVDEKNLEITLTKELCDSVKELSIFNKVNDLTGISEFSNLEHLYLNDFDSENLTEISKLQNLQFLNINNNGNSKIESINALNNLTNIKSLTLWNTKIKDINGLNDDIDLRYINISSEYEINELENNDNIVFLPEYFGELLSKCENPTLQVTFNCNLEEHEIKIDENQKYYIELDKNEYKNDLFNMREAYIRLYDLNKGIDVSILISYSMGEIETNPNNPDNPDNPNNPDNPDNPDNQNTPNEPSELEYFINNLGYQVFDNLIVDVKSKTNLESFKEELIGEKNINIVILDKDGNEINGYVTYVGTGMQIRFKDENNEFILDVNNNPITFTVTVKGDINGDGIAGDVDALYLKAYRNEMQGYELNEEQTKAIDLNSDNIVNYVDSNLLKLHRMEVAGYNLNY